MARRYGPGLLMLLCDSLTVTFGSMRVLDDVTFDVADGQVVAVMGASGSGKTTLLRVIAGLVPPTSGAVTWQGVDITSQPVHERGFGLMFQDYALFPHLSVGENVAFGLRMRGDSEDRSRSTVQRMLDLVGLRGYTDRNVAELSGGEQQRVALARTLAPAPAMVLLDEPLGALDRSRRDQLLTDIQRIFAEVGVTALYVTHDHDEAFAVAEEVIVLDAGRKVADDSPTALWRSPGRVSVATLLGFPVLRNIEVRAGTAMLAQTAVDVPLPDGIHHVALLPGSTIVDPGGQVPVQLTARRFDDGVVKAVVELDGVELVAPAPNGVVLGPGLLAINAELLAVVVD